MAFIIVALCLTVAYGIYGVWREFKNESLFNKRMKKLYDEAQIGATYRKQIGTNPDGEIWQIVKLETKYSLGSTYHIVYELNGEYIHVSVEDFFIFEKYQLYKPIVDDEPHDCGPWITHIEQIFTNKNGNQN